MWVLFWFMVFALSLNVILMLASCAILIYGEIKSKKKTRIERYPSVGVLIPHYNENPEFLLQSLDAIEKQEYPSKLVVVVADDGSTNDVQKHLNEWLSQSRKQHYISIRFEKNNGRKGKALDAALSHFPEDIEALIVLDSDTYIATEQSVMRLVERLWKHEHCVAVCGFVAPINGNRSFLERMQYFEHISMYPAIKCAQDELGQVSVMAGAFVVHRMSAVRKIGGWSPWVVEDMAWTWTALANGYTTGYAPEAVAYTYAPTTFAGLFKQRRRWARGRVEAFRAAFDTKMSFGKGLFLITLFVRYLLGLLPGTIMLLPFLAIYCQQWWALQLMAFAVILLIGMFLLYQRKLPVKMRHNFTDVLRSMGYNYVFALYLWKPNLLGFLDELFKRKKAWLTR